MDTHKRTKLVFGTTVGVCTPAVGLGFVSTADPGAVLLGFGFICIGFVLAAAMR